MATCSASDLLAESACFCALGNKQLDLVKVALLCQLWQQNNPMAECDVSSLLSDARCFDCLTPKEISIVQTQLLCEILQSGGAGGTSCLLCGDVDPVAVPACTCALYYNKTAGSLWVWDNDLTIWFAIIGA